MHTVSVRCCTAEARIIIEDSYINTNVLTDLIATSSDISFSTAVAGDDETIEVTVSVTGELLEHLLGSIHDGQLLTDHDNHMTAV